MAARRPQKSATVEKPEAVDATVDRQLGLAPLDYRWATWRSIEPLPLPSVERQPFDLYGCFAKLKQGLHTGKWWSWTDLKLPDNTSRGEAYFWLVAMVESRRNVAGNRVPTVDELVARLEGWDFSDAPTLETVLPAVRDLIHSFGFQIGSISLNVLNRLLTPVQWLSVLLEIYGSGPAPKWSQWYNIAPVDMAAVHVLPYLTTAQRTAAFPAVRAVLVATPWPMKPTYQIPVVYYLAALLGMHDDLLAEVERWPDGCFKSLGQTWSYQPQRIVFGLGSAQLVQHHMQRVGLRLRSAEQVRAWIAHTEFSRLDIVRDSFLDADRRTKVGPMLQVLCAVRAPEAAAPILAIHRAGIGQSVTRKWLDVRVGHAVAGLLPSLLAGGEGADQAADYLREVVRGGHRKMVETLAAASPELAQAARAIFDREDSLPPVFTAETTPGWLADALPKALARGPQDWVRPSFLPPIVVGQYRLADSQVVSLLSALTNSTFEKPLAGARVWKDHPEVRGLEEWAWELVDLWRLEGFPARWAWVLRAPGFFGGDVSVPRIAKLVAGWTSNGMRKRAFAAVEALQAIGSEAALRQLCHLARTHKAPKVRTAIVDLVGKQAAKQNMTYSDIEDYLIDDFGLREGRHFDYGSRRFSFAFGPNLTPLLRDPNGKAVANLPRPLVADDADKVRLAREEWQALKRQLRLSWSDQSERLEEAMLNERRWRADLFEQHVLRRPLLGQLARLLLWAGYDADGKCVRTFRVTEDQTYTDLEDAVITLANVVQVGLPHPAQLTSAERVAWAERFAEHELIQPFAQLGRPVFEPLADEAREVVRFQGKGVSGRLLMEQLRPRGWVLRYENGYRSLGRRFAGTTAILTIDPGIRVGRKPDDSTQRLGPCIMVPNEVIRSRYGKIDPETRVPLAAVVPMILSEVYADLLRLPLSEV